MVLVFAPEKTDTAAACVFDPAASVNVGLLAVAVSVGASLTAVTVIVVVALSVCDVPFEPSVTETLIVRCVVEGSSDEFVYRMEASAAAICASVVVAVPVSVRTPVAELYKPVIPLMVEYTSKS